MNIKDFNYIVAVVDYGSFSRAAEALFLSQPSLSAFIRNIERQQGFRFFENDKRTLTPEGEVYVSYARKIIELDQQLSQELDQMRRHKNQQIRIGMTTGRSEQFLDSLYDHFLQPDIEYSLDIAVETSQKLIDKVIANELDLILLNHPQDTRGLASQVIFTDRLLLAAHNANPIVKLAYSIPGDKYRHLPVVALVGRRFIIFPKGRSIRAAFDRLCEENELTPNIVQESPNMRSACKLVSRNHGLTFVFDNPWETKALGTNCECFYVDSPCLNIDYLLAYKADLPLSREFKRAIQLVKDTIRSVYERSLGATS